MGDRYKPKKHLMNVKSCDRVELLGKLALNVWGCGEIYFGNDILMFVFVL